MRRKLLVALVAALGLGPVMVALAPTAAAVTPTRDIASRTRAIGMPLRSAGWRWFHDGGGPGTPVGRGDPRQLPVVTVDRTLRKISIRLINLFGERVNP